MTLLHCGGGHVCLVSHVPHASYTSTILSEVAEVRVFCTLRSRASLNGFSRETSWRASGISEGTNPEEGKLDIRESSAA